MSEKINFFFRILFFLLLLSSNASGQDIFNYRSSGFYNDVVTGNGFVIYYEMDINSGALVIEIKDEDFVDRLSKEYMIGKDFTRSNVEVVGETVYILFTNRYSSKIITVIDTNTLEVKFYPVTISLGTIGQFKIIGNTILVVQSLENGDFVQLYDYKTGIQISLPELYIPKTRIWDIEVKDGIFDLLVHKKGDYRNQSLMMIGLNVSGSKLYETEIIPPGTKRLIFKSGSLIPSLESGYNIVGTYSKKQGEQFAGYYHVKVNDLLEQKSTVHPMASLEGFFDYKKGINLRKNSKKLPRDLKVHHIKSNGEFIALASSSGRVVRRFVHFILMDDKGAIIYDTSVKVFYGYEGAFQNSTLALVDKDLFFIWEGSPKYNVLPGHKMFQISDGNLSGLLKASDYSPLKNSNPDWKEVKYFHWKDNKFIVLSLENLNGFPTYTIRQIEI